MPTPTPTIDPDRLANALSTARTALTGDTWMGIDISSKISDTQLQDFLTKVLAADDKFRAAPTI